MRKCRNCGSSLEAGDKFCGYCGTPYVEEIKEQKRKVVETCPKCGAQLHSFQAFCPYCGYELRDVGPANSVETFSLKYNSVEDLSEKISLIQTFAIPNTKEDILEFAILAASNINTAAYSSVVDEFGDISLNDTAKQALIEAWVAKLEQVYRKASLSIPGTKEFKEIEKIYYEKTQTISYKKEKQIKTAQKKKFAKTWGYLIVCGVILLICAAVPTSLAIAHSVGANNCRKWIEQANQLLAEGKYDEALKTARKVSLHDGWSDEDTESWDEKRQDVIDDIYKKSGRDEYMAKIPEDDFEGKNYSLAISAFDQAGFTNITTSQVHDLITGWITKDGSVIDIYIDGSTTYPFDGWAEKTVQVIVEYHTF